MKKCRACGVLYEDPEDGFYKATWGGFRSPCKSCILARCKKYVAENHDAHKQRQKDHYSRNKKYYREKRKKWASENPERLREIQKAQRQKRESKEVRNIYAANLRKDPKNRIVNSVRTGISRSIKGFPGKVRHLPYTTEELRQHLERQFTKGMTWENYGEWHVDHIVPVSSFDFSGDPSDPNFQACWALTNLRPMWAKENIAKRNKITHLI